jgi:hypothetical protein
MSSTKEVGKKVEENDCKEASSFVSYYFTKNLSSIRKQLKKLEEEKSRDGFSLALYS